MATERELAQRAKDRKAARAIRNNETPDQKSAREAARAKAGRAKEVSENTIKVPLMVGDIPVGALTIHSSGILVARITGASYGEALYAAAQAGRLSRVNLAPTLFAEVRNG